MRVSSRESRDTRAAILDAAERLFAENGIDGSSLRAITSAAGVNVAAVNYHFGSRENLVRELFASRTRPANEERIRRLEQVMSSSSPSVRGIVRALVDPVLEAIENPATGTFIRIMGRAHSEPSELVRSIMREEFARVFEVFFEAFRTVLPELSDRDLIWRLQFSIGAMVQVICGPQVVELFAHGRCDEGSREELSERLVSFITAGFEARTAFDTGEKE